MNSGGSSNVSLKYERYASSGRWNFGITKLAFVAKTQFLYEWQSAQYNDSFIKIRCKSIFLEQLAWYTWSGYPHRIWLEAVLPSPRDTKLRKL